MKVMLLQANLEVDDASMKVLYASSWKKRDDRVVGDRGSPSWPHSRYLWLHNTDGQSWRVLHTQLFPSTAFPTTLV